MPRGDNLTTEMRSRGGRNSHSGGRHARQGSKGGQTSSSHKEEKKEHKGMMGGLMDKIT